MFGGAPPEMLEQLAAEDIDFEIEPDNWPIVAMFLRLETQWRVSVGGPTGLDYCAVESLLRIFGVDDQPKTFDCIRTMETAALRVMLERSK